MGKGRLLSFCWTVCSECCDVPVLVQTEKSAEITHTATHTHTHTRTLIHSHLGNVSKVNALNQSPISETEEHGIHCSSQLSRHTMHKAVALKHLADVFTLK